MPYTLAEATEKFAASEFAKRAFGEDAVEHYTHFFRTKDGGPAKQNVLRFLAQRPEQPLFFISVILLTVLLFIKVSAGMVTLAWGIESIVVFLLALFAKERSFRLTGLALLILCVAKIVFRDVWNFSDPAARYLTLIGLGAILLLVSYLYGKNREALREYL